MPWQKIISQLYLLTSLIRANHVRQFQLQRRQLVKNYVCHRVALLSCEKKYDIIVDWLQLGIRPRHITALLQIQFFTGSLVRDRYKKLRARVFHGPACINLIFLLPTTAFSDLGKPPLSPTRSHLLCIFWTFWLFLSFCRTASQPYVELHQCPLHHSILPTQGPI